MATVAPILFWIARYRLDWNVDWRLGIAIGIGFAIGVAWAARHRTVTVLAGIVVVWWSALLIVGTFLDDNPSKATPIGLTLGAHRPCQEPDCTPNE